jgi:hypothetical protein
MSTTRIYLAPDFPTVREIALEATGRPDEWLVTQGSTSSRFIEPGVRLWLTEDQLVPLVRVNWDRIPGAVR